MTFKFEPLAGARVAFDDGGTPYSELYDDVYHARQGALEQANHVFLRGNGLPGRWRGKPSFTVCETGFGLGQNFLALWRAWQQDPQRSLRLHMVSFEAHPLTRGDLARVLLPRVAADVSGLARQLVEHWPALLPGLHRLEFEGGAVTLTLAFGAISRFAKLVQATADAFFLDGFTPRKNPQMWTPSLFGQLVRLAARDATAATWCTTREVRDAMSDAGFLVSRAPGLGGRDMTVAVLRPNLGRVQSRIAPRDPVLIIGGGLAGAGIAHSLALRGQESVVIDPVFSLGLGASHKGHRAAAITPLISRDDDLRARLSRAGTQRALQRWQSLPQGARPHHCGTVELVQDVVEEQERRKILAALSFPPEWVAWLDSTQASERIGFQVSQGGVYFSDGQLVRPEALIAALLGQGAVRTLTARVARLIPRRDGFWQAVGDDGAVLAQASSVVLASAVQATELLPPSLRHEALPKLAAMHALAGQVSYFSQNATHDPRLVVGGVGYWLPGIEGINVGGSTYVPHVARSAVTMTGRADIVRKLSAMLDMPGPQLLDWAATGQEQGWAGWRAVVSGRLPVIGPLEQAPGLWLACAYGSRGLTWSALAGDVVGALLHHEPMPLERDLLRAVAPR